MAIVFDHAVKWGGKYYPANTPIDERKAMEKPVEKPVEAKKPAKGRRKGDA